MKTTYTSRVLSATFHFYTAPSSGGYVYCSTIGDKQICKGGSTMGDTLTAYSEAELKRVVRNWMRAYVKKQLEWESFLNVETI